MIFNTVTNDGVGYDPLINKTIRFCTDSGVSSIRSYAFYYCSKLQSVNFPNCSYIGGYAFYSCINLQTVSFPNCSYISDSAFYYCSSLQTVSFPNCRQITDYAFYNCRDLQTVSLSNCSNIANYAFRNCYNLISLYLMSTSVVSLPYSTTFYSTPIAGYSTYASRYGSIYVPASLFNSYKTATNWSYFSSRFVSV